MRNLASARPAQQVLVVHDANTGAIPIHLDLLMQLHHQKHRNVIWLIANTAATLSMRLVFQARTHRRHSCKTNTRVESVERIKRLSVHSRADQRASAHGRK